MFEFNLYDLENFNILENLFKLNNYKKNIVVLCVGTLKYFNDSFGVIFGDLIKELNIYCYGCKKHEVNGLNYLQVYNFIREKHKSAKIIVIDSVFVKSDKKPILIYKNSPINVSCLNNNNLIGDEGILFNSFSYSNTKCFNKTLYLLRKMFEKII
ncbi:MAG: DUF1256 domain-containing protein [Clostridiales bacterium]|nr:DUF1256 domain-containing protein [Clostridiales bacterium]